MTLNTTHPQFDTAGELPCLLHTGDRITAMDDLVADLGVTEFAIKGLVDTLKLHGVPVYVARKGGYRFVVIEPDGAAFAEEKALTYWAAIYGDVRHDLRDSMAQTRSRQGHRRGLAGVR